MAGKTLKSIMWAILLVVVVSGMASADEYHYVNQLIGDRASGMGGAYTAISDDATGLFYNPAGIMYATGANMSASVNSYSLQTKKYDNVIGGQGWERKSTSLLPNFFGVLQPMGKFKFGLSYAVPDSISEDQDQTFNDVPSTTPGITVTQYVINFNNEDRTYNFGPSLAMDMNKDMAIGVTLYFHKRTNQLILNQNLTKNTAPVGYEWNNTNFELNEWGFKPILGFIWSPMEKLSVGLSASKVCLLRASARAQSTTVTFDSAGGSQTYAVVDSNAKRKYPLQLRMGAAYFPSSSLLLSGDLAYSAKVTDPDYGDRVSVINATVGAEYYTSKTFAVRAGLYTDMSSSPEPVAGKFGQSEKVDIYGLTASASWFTKNTSVTLGGVYAVGDGKAQVLGGSSSIQDVSTEGFTIFLSSSYSY
jgi:long-subunit fatty acid transport protein